MSLTKYVSAEWVEPTMEGMPRSIKAIGDDGLEYWLPGDTINPETREPVSVVNYDVPPWPDFVESVEGKAFLAKKPPVAKAKK